MLTVQHTLNFEAASARADAGIERAARKAEKVSPDWVDKAADMLRIGAVIMDGQHTAEFTIEHLRALVEKALPEPTDKRAWGAATRVATSRGFIERIPGRYAAAASSNGSQKPLYRKGSKAC
jgi:hypothetical protein